MINRREELTKTNFQYTFPSFLQSVHYICVPNSMCTTAIHSKNICAQLYIVLVDTVQFHLNKYSCKLSFVKIKSALKPFI